MKKHFSIWPGLILLLVLMFPAAAKPLSISEEVASCAGWSWFSEPRTVFFAGKTVVGYVRCDGQIAVASRWSYGWYESIVGPGASQDDHNNPVFYARRDKRLQAFWTGHGSRYMYSRISAKNDPSRWGKLMQITPQRHAHFTYVNPVRMKGRLYVFFRGRGRQQTYVTSKDGVQFSAAEQILENPGQRPYVKYAAGPSGHIGAAFTEAHPSELGRETSVYFANIRPRRPSDRARGRSPLVLTSADGKKVFSMHMNPAYGNRISPQIPGASAWVDDIAYDSEDNPRVLLTLVFADGSRQYYSAMFDGRQWNTNLITDAGRPLSFLPLQNGAVEKYYSGGLSFDRSNPDRIFLSRTASEYDHFAIEEWIFSNGSGEWVAKKKRRIQSPENAMDSIRPIVASGPGGMCALLWMSGVYPNFYSFDTAIKFEACSDATKAF